MSRPSGANRDARTPDDRAVSETIGFVLAFALVTASVGVVYTAGIGGLEDAQEDEQLTNAVRAFEVLADNVADIQRDGAPSRATELKLQGASVGFGARAQFVVQVNHTELHDVNATYEASARPLVYDDDAGSVVYSGGAIFRVEADWTAMDVEPGFVLDDDRAVVPFLVTYPQGDGGIGGDSTVLVVAHRQSSGLEGRVDLDEDADPARVNVTVASPRAAAWARYFEDAGLTAIDGDPSDGNVTYQFETRRLLVPETVVEFELQP